MASSPYSVSACSVSSSPYSSLSSHSSSSSSSIATSSSYSSATRCQGLDLLVKAAHCIVASESMSMSIIGVPFIQKRVLIRRRRRSSYAFEEFSHKGEVFFKKNDAKGKKKRQKKAMVWPSKYQDSVVQTWKRRQSRRNRSSSLQIQHDLDQL